MHRFSLRRALTELDTLLDVIMLRLASSFRLSVAQVTTIVIPWMHDENVVFHRPFCDQGVHGALVGLRIYLYVSSLLSDDRFKVGKYMFAATMIKGVLRRTLLTSTLASLAPGEVAWRCYGMVIPHLELLEHHGLGQEGFDQRTPLIVRGAKKSDELGYGVEKGNTLYSVDTLTARIVYYLIAHGEQRHGGQ